MKKTTKYFFIFSLMGLFVLMAMVSMAEEVPDHATEIYIKYERFFKYDMDLPERDPSLFPKYDEISATPFKAVDIDEDFRTSSDKKRQWENSDYNLLEIRIENRSVVDWFFLPSRHVSGM